MEEFVNNVWLNLNYSCSLKDFRRFIWDYLQLIDFRIGRLVFQLTDIQSEE